MPTLRWGAVPDLRSWFAPAVLALLALVGGCSTAHIAWPGRPTEERAVNGDMLLSYDVVGSGKPNYTQRMHDGRKTVLSFDDDRDGRTDAEVRLDQPDPDWPHYVIVLDGVPYRLAADLWDEGYFRLFPRPSKVISTFPSMTDLALSRLLDAPPCLAAEAAYFDRKANRIKGGVGAYNAGLNSPWLDALTYHAPQSIGARAYLDPQGVFELELREMRAAFDRVGTGTASAYTVGTAGLGTRGGEHAIREYLKTIDRFCERLVYDRRGRVRITVTADHGHNLTRCERIGFTEHLARHGFRLTDALRGPQDVVTVRYGLVTFAQFFTSQPAAVAEALLIHPAVEVAVYPEGDRVMVLSVDGRARIGRGEGGYTYVAERGDPLQIMPIIEALQEGGKVSADGVIDDAAFFAATLDHVYPDALQRVWSCFHGLMQKPPDVIVSLRDGYCHGLWMFEVCIGHVASTHGSLNAINSTTFVLSSAGPLPEALRIDEVLHYVRPHTAD
ncbi:MAG: hypothetical protein V2A79_17905 [Planctomycetota bacterium]